EAEDRDEPFGNRYMLFLGRAELALLRGDAAGGLDLLDAVRRTGRAPPPPCPGSPPVADRVRGPCAPAQAPPWALPVPPPRPRPRRAPPAALPGIPASDGLDPWTLLIGAVSTVVTARHDPESSDELFDSLLDRAERATAQHQEHYDFPVLGTVAFAIAVWLTL